MTIALIIYGVGIAIVAAICWALAMPDRSGRCGLSWLFVALAVFWPVALASITVSGLIDFSIDRVVRYRRGRT